MSTLIQSIADWLIASHSISMTGWAWLIAVPAALVILLVVGYFIALLVFSHFTSAFRLF